MTNYDIKLPVLLPLAMRERTKKMKWEEEFRGIKSNVVKEFHCDFFKCVFFCLATAITIYIMTIFSFYFEYLTNLGPFFILGNSNSYNKNKIKLRGV